MGRLAIVDREGVVQQVIVAGAGYSPAQWTAVKLTQGQDVQPGDTYDGTFRRPDLTPEEKSARDAWESRQAALSVENQARASRRAALVALRDGTGDLTARQLTAILRVLAREVLGED